MLNKRNFGCFASLLRVTKVVSKLIFDLFEINFFPVKIHFGSDRQTVEAIKTGIRSNKLLE